MANVLPPENKKNIATEYRFRLGAVVFFGLAGVCAITILTLIPSYVFVRSHIDSTQEQIALVRETFQKQEGARYTQVINETNTKIAAARERVRDSGVEEILRSVTRVRNTGISIRRISLDQAAGEVNVSGVATERDNLLAFEERLKESQHFSSVDLPVSNLAKSREVEFSMTLTFEN